MNLCEATTYDPRAARMVQCSYEDGHDPSVPHAVMSDGVEVVWEGAGAQEPMGIISELVHYVIEDGSPPGEAPAVICETHSDGADLSAFASSRIMGDPVQIGRRRVKHDAKGSPGTWHLSAECGKTQRRR